MGASALTFFCCVFELESGCVQQQISGVLPCLQYALGRNQVICGIFSLEGYALPQPRALSTRRSSEIAFNGCQHFMSATIFMTSKNLSLPSNAPKESHRARNASFARDTLHGNSTVGRGGINPYVCLLTDCIQSTAVVHVGVHPLHLLLYHIRTNTNSARI